MITARAMAAPECEAVVTRDIVNEYPDGGGIIPPTRKVPTNG
jgi:hypothetical protein